MAVTEEQFGFSSVEDLIFAIATFLNANGFIHHLGIAAPIVASSPVILRATSAVDPLIISDTADDLNWGISLREDNAQLIVSWGRMTGGDNTADATNSELSPGGGGFRLGNEAEMTAPDSPLNAGIHPPSTPGSAPDGRDTAPVSPTNLHGFDITVTDRGFVLAIFSQIDLQDWRDFGLIVIQRPVDCTGTTLVDRKAPLFVLWNNLDPATGTHRILGSDTAGLGDQRWFKSVLLEDDVFNSIGSERTESTDATFAANETPANKDPDIRQVHFESTDTLYGWPTAWQQPITQDNNEIPLVFPFGLTTSRFSYLEELDLVCIGPACVFTFGQEIDLTVFSGARKYKTLTPSSQVSGVVVAILTQE